MVTMELIAAGYYTRPGTTRLPKPFYANGKHWAFLDDRATWPGLWYSSSTSGTNWSAPVWTGIPQNPALTGYVDAVAYLSGNKAYAAWTEPLGGIQRLYFRLMTLNADGTITLGTVVEVEARWNIETVSFDIIVDSSGIPWIIYTKGSDSAIYAAKANDADGATWGAGVQISDSVPAIDVAALKAVPLSAGNISVVYADDILDTLKAQVYVSGAWGTASVIVSRLTYTYWNYYDICVTPDDHVHIFYEDWKAGSSDDHVVYVESTDAGATWSSEAVIATLAGGLIYPVRGCGISNNDVVALWQGTFSGPFYQTLRTGGSWQTETHSETVGLWEASTRDNSDIISLVSYDDAYYGLIDINSTVPTQMARGQLNVSEEEYKPLYRGTLNLPPQP